MVVGLLVSRCFLYPPSSVEYLNIDDVSVARGTTYFDISPTLIPSEATVDYVLIRKPTEEVTISGTRINNIPEKIPLGEYNITVKARGNGGYSGVTGATFKLNVVLPPIRESCFGFSSGTGTITVYNNNCPKNVVIPASIGGVAVRIIAAFAFSGKNLTSVYIPDSVTNIGDRAFRNNNLTSVSINARTIHVFSGYYYSFDYICNVKNGCITKRP